MAYPYSMYAYMCKKELGKKHLDRDEEDYLLTFSDSSTSSSSKIIYSDALCYFKRFYPKSLIRFIVKIQVRNVLRKEKAPKSIQKLYKQMAKIIYYSAMSAYGRGKECNKAK